MEILQIMSNARIDLKYMHPLLARTFYLNDGHIYAYKLESSHYDSKYKLQTLPSTIVCLGI